MTAKLPDPLHTLTPEAKRIYDRITAKRGQMRGGPYASLMHHPALAEKVGDLGEYLRFGGTLPGDIREMAILITARSVNQSYEWVAHARIARTEKLPDDVIERIRTREDLSALPPRLARPARVVQHVLADPRGRLFRPVGERGSLGAHGAIRPVQLSASMNWRQRP